MNAHARLFVFASLALAALFLFSSQFPARASAPQPEAWNAAPSIPHPTALAGHAQCPDQPDRFYLVGGADDWNSPLADLRRYDAADSRWEALPPLPVPLSNPAAACYQGHLYVAGGRLASGQLSNLFFVYDLAASDWSQGPDLPRQVRGAALGAWNSRLYLAGGDYGNYNPTSQVDVYDLQTGEWNGNAGAPLPHPATLPAWAQAGPFLYLVGGFSGDLENNLAFTQRYDMAADAWQDGPSFPSARAAAALSVTSQGLLALGGDQDGGGRYDATPLVEFLDLAAWPSGSWADLADPLPAPALAPASYCTNILSGGEAWAAGGYSVDEQGHAIMLASNLYRPAQPCLAPVFGLSVEPALIGQLGNPGQTIAYTLVVSNTGLTPDAYDVAVASDWASGGPSLVGSLNPGQGASLVITVTIPAEALPGDSANVSVAFTSQGDPGQSASALLGAVATLWQSAAPLPAPTTLAGAVQCPDQPGSFYLFGGADAWNAPLDQAWRYDSAAADWVSLAPLPQPNWMMAAACYEGRIYLAGGMPAPDSISSLFYIYDIAADAWTQGPDLPRPVIGATLGAWDGRLYLAGGAASAYPWTPTGQVDVYDLASQIWQPAAGAPMPVPASFPGWVQAGAYLYVVGGFSGDLYNNNLAVTQRYDMLFDRWEQGPAFTSARAAFALSLTADHLLALGGDLSGGGSFDSTTLVEALPLADWPSGAWSDLGDPLPSPRQGSAGFCTPLESGGQAWVIGGHALSGQEGLLVSSQALDHPAGPCFTAQYEVQADPASALGWGEPGQTLTYTLQVSNLGNVPDYYDIDVTSLWPLTLSPTLPLTLAPGEVASLTVGVTIPAAAQPGSLDAALLALSSHTHPAPALTITLTSMVPHAGGLVLLPETAALSAHPGETLTVTLGMTNVGSLPATFTLTYTSDLCLVTLPFNSVELAPGQSAPILLTLTVPQDAPFTASGRVVLLIQSGPYISAAATLDVAVTPYRLFLPLAAR